MSEISGFNLSEMLLAFVAGMVVITAIFSGLIAAFPNYFSIKSKVPDYVRYTGVGLLVMFVLDILLWVVVVALDAVDIHRPFCRVLCVFDNLTMVCGFLFGEAILCHGHSYLGRATISIVPFVVLMVVLGLTTAGWLVIIPCILCAVVCTALFVSQTIRIVKYDKKLTARYSNIESHDYAWYIHIMGPLLALTIAWLIAPLFAPGLITVAIYDMILVAVIIVFLHRVLHMSEETIDLTVNPQSVAAKVAKTEQELAKPTWVKTLLNLMEKKKIYRQSDLDVEMVAQMLGTNRTYLGRYLRTAYDCTFYTYINNYRLDEAVQLMADANLSLNEIAEKCGFVSIQSFRNLFQKRFGCIPQDYREKKLGIK